MKTLCIVPSVLRRSSHLVTRDICQRLPIIQELHPTNFRNRMHVLGCTHCCVNWHICTCLLLPHRFLWNVCSHQQESWRTVRDQARLQTACTVCASFMITSNLHSRAYGIWHWYKLDETGNCVDAFIIVYFLFIYAVVVFICDCVQCRQTRVD